MTEIIGEVASNHGGSVELAKEFIKRFAPYCDTVKFQATRVSHLRPQDPQFAWFTQAELSDDDFFSLKDECEREGVGFLLTINHQDEVDLVERLGCRRVKIGSGEAT